MERVNRLLEHSLYREYLGKNEQAEAQRCFCRHNMGHFLDVARLAVILAMEENVQVDKELIYGAALLHDIGRWMQYEDGTPHEKASVLLAPVILRECSFTEEESSQILNAIQNHKNEAIQQEQSLSGLLYRADKLSRPCFSCEMQKECNWKQEKKNLSLIL